MLRSRVVPRWEFAGADWLTFAICAEAAFDAAMCARAATFALHSPTWIVGYEWQGTVDGIGWSKIVITDVKPGGQVEGRMEFALHSFIATFADKPHPIEKTSVGTVSGDTLILTIDAALGGTYRLVRSGDSLSGTYTRGTTFEGKASFRRQ